MLTCEGCRERLGRFRDGLEEEWDAAVLHLPEHLLYLGNFFPNPNSLNLQSSSFLLVEREGPVTLFTDNWPASGVGQDPAESTTSADRVESIHWYSCEGPARLRCQAVANALAERLRSLSVRRLAAETAHLPYTVAAAVDAVSDCEPLLRRLREVKDPDELDAIRRGIRTAEAVHAASRELLGPGVREIELYAGLLDRAVQAAESPFVMMCDLASGPRAAEGGGNPTARRIEAGELVILDIFPYVDGYRGDITNTLVAGGEPTAGQRELFDLVHAALEAAAAAIRPGTPVAEFCRIIDECYAEAGKGYRLVHHAGHAIGLGHPEAPELVRESDRVLSEGMVITLEPGLYGQPTGGVRLEHDYLVTRDGAERLSNHSLGLV